MTDFLWLAAGLLVFISLSAVHPPIADVPSGIKLQECDRGTVWDGVEKRESFLTLPTQDAQPMVKYMWANRKEGYCRKKSRHVQARRRMVWSRSTAMVIILLLLLSGDVEINPGPTDKKKLLNSAHDEGTQEPTKLLQIDTSGAAHTPPIHEDPPGVPLYHVPVNEVANLEPGDHILYRVSREPHRACYRSALVLKGEETRIHVVMNSSDGVKEEWLDSSKNLYVVKYSHCFSGGEAVDRARQRLEWTENRYHCLYNNSHHFVTLVKTGRENPLTEIIESLVHQGDTVHDQWTPVLTKVEVSNLSDVCEGDHIMTGTQHFLVACTDIAQNTFTGYTLEEGKAVKKERCEWKQNAYNICIKYEESFPSSKALENAELAVCPDSSDKVIKKWSDKAKAAIRLSDSETFVVKMKTGRKRSFNDCCLFSEKNEFSSTKITPEIALDEGDHVVVKDENGSYQSVLVIKHRRGNELLVIPDLTSAEQYGTLDIEKYTEVYRINYKQSLPVDDVFQRVTSKRGHEALQACGSGSSQFVSWAKTGKKEVINVLQLKQQIAQVDPLQREKILCVDEIRVGDHLIKEYLTHKWHFMITEPRKPGSSQFKTIYSNSYDNRISETTETLDPTKDVIYRIIYPESLPVATAIKRARSIGHTKKIPFIERVWFIPWAKTGSDKGIEIDLLLNNAMPASKSRICTFAQLNPGDYLVEETRPLHHYLVTEVQSPTCCVVIESWERRVTKSTLTLRKNHYYRINYNDGACIPPHQAIAKAQELVGKVTITHLKYVRWTFVNYLKTGNATAIKIDALQDDRILLRRERVESTLQLRPGDRIERPVPNTLGAAYHHMMVIEAPADEQKCKVIHFHKEKLQLLVGKEEIDIVEQGDNFFRIKYTERHEPEGGIEYLWECVQAVEQQSMLKKPTEKQRMSKKDLRTPKCKELTQEMEMERVAVDAPQIQPVPKYSLDSNNCEHLIMKATVNDHLSIQVEEGMHKALQGGTAAIICAGATLGKTLHAFHAHVVGAGIHTAATGVKSIATAGAKGGTKAGALYAGGGAAAGQLFQLGFRSALSGSAIGLIAGVAFAVNIAIEGPLFVRAVHKLHRKKKFGHLSSAQVEQGIVKESITSANTVAGAVGGAIVGQVAIPVPILGAAVGGAVGGFTGQTIGRLEGLTASKLFAKRVLTLPHLVTPTLIDIPPPTD